MTAWMVSARLEPLGAVKRRDARPGIPTSAPGRSPPRASAADSSPMVSTAVSVLSTSRLVSRNHSTAGSPGGGAVSRTWTVDSATGSAPAMVGRRHHLAMAHLGPRHPPGARRAGLPAAGFAPRAQPVDLDLDVPVGGAGAHGGEQLRGALGETAVMVGAHQHFHPVQTALLVEHREAIRLPVHDADAPASCGSTPPPPGRCRAARRPSAASWGPSPAPPSGLSWAVGGRLVALRRGGSSARERPRRPAAPRNRSAARPAADPRHRPPGSDADAGRASSRPSGCAR